MERDLAFAELSALYAENKRRFYDELIEAAKALLDGETNWLANMANLSALLYATLPRINWTGFYLAVNIKDQGSWDQGKCGGIKPDECGGTELVLGPFQGRPACTRIQPGKGVCGAAARDRKVYIVPDVHKFPGHIACDPRSRSEIVVPIISEGKLVGVLDIDSPYQDRFDEIDGEGLSRLTAVIQYSSTGVFSSFLDSPV